MALTDKLTAIADAIRAKTGKTESLTLDQMPTEISSITTGGGSSEDVRYVTFMNGDVELYKKPVAVGDDCVDVVAKGLIPAPTKESTVQYNYTHYGWGAENGGAADADILKNITEDKTVYAIYTEVARTYTITYYDSDGTTVLKTEQVAYGSTPNYTPKKDGVIFGKWTPTPVAVTGDASYVASWLEAITLLPETTVTTNASGYVSLQNIFTTSMYTPDYDNSRQGVKHILVVNGESYECYSILASMKTGAATTNVWMLGNNNYSNNYGVGTSYTQSCPNTMIAKPNYSCPVSVTLRMKSTDYNTTPVDDYWYLNGAANTSYTISLLQPV